MKQGEGSRHPRRPSPTARLQSTPSARSDPIRSDQINSAIGRAGRGGSGSGGRQVADEGVRVDAEVVVDRRQHVVVVDRVVLRRRPPILSVEPITWPTFMPPPASSARVDRRPVVAAGVLVDLRRAAELAPDARPSRRWSSPRA